MNSTTFTSWRRDSTSDPWGLSNVNSIKASPVRRGNGVEQRTTNLIGKLLWVLGGCLPKSSVDKNTSTVCISRRVSTLQKSEFPASMNSISPDESQSFSDTHEIIGLRAQIKGMLRDPRWHSYLWQSPTDGSRSKCQSAFPCKPRILIQTSHIRSRHPSDQIWWQGKAV